MRLEFTRFNLLEKCVVDNLIERFIYSHRFVKRDTYTNLYQQVCYIIALSYSCFKLLFQAADFTLTLKKNTLALKTKAKVF